MRKNKLSFFRLFEKIDADNSNMLSRKELSDFLLKEVKQSLSPNEMNQVLNYFDKSRDGKLSVKEFMETVKGCASNISKEVSLFQNNTSAQNST